MRCPVDFVHIPQTAAIQSDMHPGFAAVHLLVGYSLGMLLLSLHPADK